MDGDGDGAAGVAAVREVLVLVFVGVAVSVQAIESSAMATHVRASEISFIRQFLRVELFFQGAMSIAVTSSTSQSTQQSLASAARLAWLKTISWAVGVRKLWDLSAGQRCRQLCDVVWPRRRGTVESSTCPDALLRHFGHDSLHRTLCTMAGGLRQLLQPERKQRLVLTVLARTVRVSRLLPQRLVWIVVPAFFDLCGR